MSSLHAKRHGPIALFMLLMTLFASPATRALDEKPQAGKGEKGEKGDDDDEHAAIERDRDGLPKFKHPYTDGLYSTVTAMNMFNVQIPDKQKKQKLKVPGFRHEMPIYTITQDVAAPLVVVLMGVDGKVEGPWGSLFPSWYSEAGYNVLTFDGTFTAQYPSWAGQGCVGNFDAEAGQIAAIVDAYLKADATGKIAMRDGRPQVGVVGMSFGGIQALLLAAKSKEGKLPFEISGCLALSPPVNLHTAAKIVDRFFAEDRWETTMAELARKFMSHLPVAEGAKIPFSASEMRAAIGFAFRDGLSDVVDRNDRAYGLKVLPSTDPGTEEDRGTYVQATGLERFIEKFTFKYWQKKGKVSSVDELWDAADLSKILPRLPDYAEVVIAANDPFDTPEDIAAAKAADIHHRLTVVPVGGHLGFLAAHWTLVKALRIFGRKVLPAAVAIEDNRTPDEARKEALDAVNEALKQPIPPPPPEKEKK